MSAIHPRQSIGHIREVVREDLLLAPAAAPPEIPPPSRPPLAGLTALLIELRATERLPWPDVTVAMAEEQRMLALARSAGAEGKRLATAIMDETERLFAAAEQEAANASMSSAS